MCISHSAKRKCNTEASTYDCRTHTHTQENPGSMASRKVEVGQLFDAHVIPMSSESRKVNTKHISETVSISTKKLFEGYESAGERILKDIHTSEMINGIVDVMIDHNAKIKP